MEDNKYFEKISDNAGLVCDNPNCDWEDATITNEEMPSWINASCPKCGENVLTQEDFDSYENVDKLITDFNKLSPGEMEEMFKELVTQDPSYAKAVEEMMANNCNILEIKCHKGVSFNMTSCDGEDGNAIKLTN